MKIKFNLLFILIIIAVFVIPSKAWSQKKAEIIKTRWAEKSIEVNGILSDWKDSLDLYNADTKLFYSIANDHENIYLAVKNSSEDNLTKILARGISFTVNFENTKKVAPTVTFPVLDRTPGKKQVETEQPEAKEIQRRIISKIKEIKVEGFKELVDGGISLYNTYGIKAVLSLDEKNDMIQEIAIPLRLLGIESGSTELITYRIRINGFQGSASIQQRDMNDYDDLYGGTYGDRFNRRSGRNYNGMYGGMPRRNYLSTNTTNSTEFFIKSALAAKQN
jgi:lipoprotein-anchoring transpeptidase ErfK/SrfK